MIDQDIQAVSLTTVLGACLWRVDRLGLAGMRYAPSQRRILVTEEIRRRLELAI
jgi:hypothetical protein